MRFPPILMVSERVSGGRILQVENSHLRGVRRMHATRLVCLHVEYAGFNVFLSSSDAICVFLLNPMIMASLGGSEGGGYYR